MAQKRYTVLVTEKIVTEYLIEVETDLGQDEAFKMAEDIIVNHEEAALAAIQSEHQESIKFEVV